MAIETPGKFMITLIAGLALFIGPHLIRVVADDTRTAWRERLGEGTYKGVYSLVTTLGLVLATWGYGETRAAPVDLWWPPVWTRHAAALGTVPAFVLLAAAYVPRTHMKATVGHPMLLGTVFWSASHLLANGRLGDVVLFGAFLAWSVVLFAASRARDRRAGIVVAPGAWSRDALAAGIGLLLWGMWAFWLHAVLFGVAPFV
jgi:uncharacterized membrane protein